MVRVGKVIFAEGFWRVAAVATLLLAFSLAGCAPGQSGEAPAASSPDASAASGEETSAEAPPESANSESGGEPESVSPFVGTWDYESGLEQAGAAFASDSLFYIINDDGTVETFVGLTEDELASASGDPSLAEGSTWRQTGDRTADMLHCDGSVSHMKLGKKGKLLMWGDEHPEIKMTCKRGEPRNLDDYRRVDFKKAVLVDDDLCKVELLSMFNEVGTGLTTSGVPTLVSDKYLVLKVTNKAYDGCTFDLDAYLADEKLDVMYLSNVGPKRGKSAQFKYRLRKQSADDVTPLKSVAAMYGIEATLVFRGMSDGALGEKHTYDVLLADAKGKAKKK